MLAFFRGRFAAGSGNPPHRHDHDHDHDHDHEEIVFILGGKGL